MKRMLVLTSDYGRGHRSAAEALAACVGAWNEPLEIRIANPLHHQQAPPAYRWSEREYLRSVRCYPWGYDWLFHGTDSPARSGAIRHLVARQLQPAVQALLREWPADTIVGTFPILTFAARLALEQETKPLLVTTVTDPGKPHSLWFDPEDDLCTVATPEAYERAIAVGCAANRVATTGVPIHPAFAAAPAPATARARLGWHATLPAVLVTGGGAGIGGMLAVAEQIEAACLPVQLALVAGSNVALYQTLQQRRWRIPIFVYGNLPILVDVLSAADMVVSRAGGLSTSEACALGKPLILYGSSPGQERRNREFLCEQGAAIHAASPAAVAAGVRDWLERPEQMAAASAAACKLGRPDAARVILDRVLAHAAQKDARLAEL